METTSSSCLLGTESVSGKPGAATTTPYTAGSTLTSTAIPVEKPLGTSPNGDAQADGEIPLLSHEIFEAVTDPAYNFRGKAWQDNNGKEISDKCETAAANLPRNAEGENIYLHGDPYRIGSRWSNYVSGCSPDLCGESDCGQPLSLSLNGDVTVQTAVPIRYSFKTDNPSDTDAAATSLANRGFALPAPSKPSSCYSSNSVSALSQCTQVSWLSWQKPLLLPFCVRPSSSPCEIIGTPCGR